MSEQYCLIYGEGVQVIANFEVIAQITRDLIEEGKLIKPRLYEE